MSDLYYDPYDFDIDTDPYPIWKRLRDEAPLYYNDHYDVWALSRHADVEQGLVVEQDGGGERRRDDVVGDRRDAHPEDRDQVLERALGLGLDPALDELAGTCAAVTTEFENAPAAATDPMPADHTRYVGDTSGFAREG